MSLDKLIMVARPGIAYQYAFDWLVVALRRVAGLIGYVECADFQTAELVRRMRSIKPVSQRLNESTYLGIAWIEPCHEDLANLPKIKSYMAPNGRLFIITGGVFSRFLEERRNSPEANYANKKNIYSLLKEEGFIIEERIGLHSIWSIIWHQLSVVMERLGFEHLRDRCHYAMRRDFVVRQGPAALVCLTARMSKK